MSVRPVLALPVTYVRSHTKKVLREVNKEMEHVLITHHGKPVAGLIPMQDLRVLWQLQRRPVKEMEQRLQEVYADWRRAKKVEDEGWEGMELDERRWVSYWGLQKM